ncbi:MAG TPA: hypothetical protein VHD32_02585 [Candidatus Didemnitutus sp.]|nr:hypothetical protein [Candidatus Didemnitutus sp.]
MNSCAHPSRAARWRQACFLLATRLLRLASLAFAALPFSVRAARESRPYLTVVMAAPLRFAEPPPPPAAPAPKSIDSAAVPTGVPTPAGNPANPAPVAVAAGDNPTPEIQPAAASHDAAKPPAPADKANNPPPAILPDEARPKVHAEDFLPYFQFPGAGPNPNDVIVAPTPPEPGKLPPSSASYRQQ